jgi:Organic Anion Transporter Polypeptide (OATP) family
MMVKYEKMKSNEEITPEALENYSVEKSCKILPVVMLIGTICGTGGTIFSYFFARPYDYVVYFFGITIAQFFVFMTISPVAMAIMNCVPTRLRGQANAISVFFMHALGDFPSPAIIGVWFDTIGQLMGMVLTTGWLLIAVVFWTIAWNISVIDK